MEWLTDSSFDGHSNVGCVDYLFFFLPVPTVILQVGATDESYRSQFSEIFDFQMLGISMF